MTKCAVKVGNHADFLPDRGKQFSSLSLGLINIEWFDSRHLETPYMLRRKPGLPMTAASVRAILLVRNTSSPELRINFGQRATIPNVFRNWI